MKKFFIIILLFVSAIEVCSQHPAALKLNDSAVALIQGDAGTFADYEKAIDLLNQATIIDSNYYLAYGNKISFLFGLRRYPEALKVVERMRRIKPGLPEPVTMTGLIYELMSDSVSAKKYFEDAVLMHDQKLSTLYKDSSGYEYEAALVNKAVNMILAGQEEKGQAILKKINDQQLNTRMRVGSMAYEMLGKTRQQIIDSFTDH